jgi:hypothetical protein
MFVEHPSSMAAASVAVRGASLRRRWDAPRGATETVGARRGARDTRTGAVVVRRDAFGLGTAALGARRAAVRLCVDAQGLRRASLRVGTDAPFNPTDALPVRSAPFVSTYGCSRSSHRRSRRSLGNSTKRTGRPWRTMGRSARTSGRSLRTSGRSSHSQGRRAKARTAFAKSHVVIAQFSSCPTHLSGNGADARSGARHARRPFACAAGRRRRDSRRPTSRGRRPR